MKHQTLPWRTLILAVALGGAQHAAYAVQGPPAAQDDTTEAEQDEAEDAVGETGQVVGNQIGSSISGFAAGPSGGTSSAGTQRFALRGPGETGAAAAAGSTRWNGWVALGQANIATTFQPQASSGRVNIALGGIDYTLNNKAILGVAVTDERLRLGTSFNSGSIRGDGNTIAPYFAWNFTPSLTMDLSAGFGRTRLALVNGTTNVSGATNSMRSMLTAGLAWRQSVARWQFTSRAALSTTSDRLSAYTNSANTAIAASTARVSQLRLGSQAAYGGWAGVIPFAGLNYIYDIEAPYRNPVRGQAQANDRDGWQVVGGLLISGRGPVYGGVTLSSQQGRKESKNDQITLNLGIRF